MYWVVECWNIHITECCFWKCLLKVSEKRQAALRSNLHALHTPCASASSSLIHNQFNPSKRAQVKVVTIWTKWAMKTNKPWLLSMESLLVMKGILIMFFYKSLCTWVAWSPTYPKQPGVFSWLKWIASPSGLREGFEAVGDFHRWR